MSGLWKEGLSHPICASGCAEKESAEYSIGNNKPPLYGYRHKTPLLNFISAFFPNPLCQDTLFGLSGHIHHIHLFIKNKLQ